MSEIRIVEREPWMESGNCVNTDPNLFILENGQSSGQGKGFCRTCPHTGLDGKCFNYAVRTGSVGIWGGVVIAMPISSLKAARMRAEAKSKGNLQDARPKSSKSQSAVSRKRSTVYPSTVAARAQ